MNMVLQVMPSHPIQISIFLAISDAGAIFSGGPLANYLTGHPKNHLIILNW